MYRDDFIAGPVLFRVFRVSGGYRPAAQKRRQRPPMKCAHRPHAT
jgi:hypothetical protein